MFLNIFFYKGKHFKDAQNIKEFYKQRKKFDKRPYFKNEKIISFHLTDFTNIITRVTNHINISLLFLLDSLFQLRAIVLTK